MSLRSFVSGMVARARMTLYRGNKYFCPLCRTSYSSFLSMGKLRRPNARCPGCGSLERHRLLWVSIEHLYRQGVLKKGGRLLHVAPEDCIAKRLRDDYECISVDMYGLEVEARADITSLCFPDACFDVVICNHVLEHVPEDRKALSELYRVLKPGGWASVQIPIDGEKTLEDLSIVDPAERERLYGQSDHVRQYGKDFVDRLQAAGFSLFQLRKQDLLAPLELDRFSVECEEAVILGIKPIRKAQGPTGKANSC